MQLSLIGALPGGSCAGPSCKKGSLAPSSEICGSPAWSGISESWLAIVSYESPLYAASRALDSFTLQLVHERNITSCAMSIDPANLVGTSDPIGLVTLAKAV